MLTVHTDERLHSTIHDDFAMEQTLAQQDPVVRGRIHINVMGTVQALLLKKTNLGHKTGYSEVLFKALIILVNILHTTIHTYVPLP